MTDKCRKEREQEILQLKNFAEYLADINNYYEVKTQDGKLAFMFNHERSCIDLAREALGLQREPLKLLVRLEWEDKDDELTPAIDAAHPLKTGDHKTRQEANQLVSNRHSKESLIGLVNYLLVQNKGKEQEIQRLREALEYIDMGVVTFNEKSYYNCICQNPAKFIELRQKALQQDLTTKGD